MPRPHARHALAETVRALKDAQTAGVFYKNPALIQLGTLETFGNLQALATTLPLVLADHQTATIATPADLAGGIYQAVHAIRVLYLDDPISTTVAGQVTWDDDTLAARLEYLRRVDALVAALVRQRQLTATGALPGESTSEKVMRAWVTSVDFDPPEQAALLEAGIVSVQAAAVNLSVEIQSRTTP